VRLNKKPKSKGKGEKYVNEKHEKTYPKSHENKKDATQGQRKMAFKEKGKGKRGNKMKHTSGRKVK